MRYFQLGVTMAAVAVAVAQGQDIVITKTGAEKIDINLAGLQADAGVAQGVRGVLLADLGRSGWFRCVDGDAAIVVRGTCADAGGRVVIEAEVINQATGRRYLSRRYEESTRTWRRAPHRLADDIVYAVKGVQGIASSRIALIGSISGRKNLYLCDADGEGLVQMTKDNAPCVTPGWSPDGGTIYYMSFHLGYPDIYRIALATGRRDPVSRQPGMNAGPDISPDGKFMALTLSRDGNPELYVMHLASGRLERLTRTHQASEASPSWSPDGREITFVSDRTGSPQVYVVSHAGGSARRLTFRGTENVAPDWGPDGRIAVTSRRDGRYGIVVLDPKTGDETPVTTGGGDYEEPSWAPDGRHIVCVKTVAYQMNVYLLDTLGDPELRLLTTAGDWYSPAWSPQ